MKNYKNKNTIMETQFKGQIAGFPTEVVEKMLTRQEEQGNKRDIIKFEIYKCVDDFNGGFDWDKTIEGEDFWISVIREKNFDKFFKKYPKASEPPTLYWIRGDYYRGDEVINALVEKGGINECNYTGKGKCIYYINKFKEISMTQKEQEESLMQNLGIELTLPELTLPEQPLTFAKYQERVMQTDDVHYDNYFPYMLIKLIGKVDLDKSESDLLKLKKEFGDALWLLTGLCKVMGWSLEDVAKTNLEQIADSVKGGSN